MGPSNRLPWKDAYVAKKKDRKADKKRKAEDKKPKASKQRPSGKAAKKGLQPDDLRAALRVGPDFTLAELDARATPGFSGDKTAAAEAMDAVVEEISELQERLYAQGRDGAGPSLLLVIQGMDTSGKGGIVRHVVGEVDPQGVQLTSFKAPTAEEKRHPFLWRIRRRLPAPGYIGVFDRSHYEDVLIGRVRNLAPYSTLKGRYQQINTFEASVRRNKDIRLIKVMLHISPEEQKARLMERLERPDKRWKFNPGDVDERQLWGSYQEAYQLMLERTSTDDAPWYVVPADRKWYARLAVQQLLLAHLRDLDPQWPQPSYDVATETERLAAT
jgi:PPK2 family polyphosphate:nucleotide phosphotransferase